MTREIKVGKVKFGAKSPLVLIAGPCVIESAAFTLGMAKKLKSVTETVGMPFIFKSSYDKANRL